MSTGHDLLPGFEITEQSYKVCFDVDPHRAYTYEELRYLIVKQIEILSYISDDPEKDLERFNVDYGQVW